MSDNVTIAIISTLGGIILAIVTAWSKTYFENLEKKVKLNNITSGETIKKFIKIQAWLDSLVKKYNLDRAIIFQFHNGEYFQNGSSILKFSATYESTKPGIISLKEKFKNLFVSEYPKWINSLISNKYVYRTIDKIKDEKTLEDFRVYGIKTSLSIPIKNINNTLTGFLWITFIEDEIDLTEQQILEICNSMNILTGYLDTDKK